MSQESVLLYIQRYLHNDVLIAFMTAVSLLGSYGFIWIVITIFTARKKKNHMIAIVTLAVLASCAVVVDIVLKGLIGAARPYVAVPEIKALWSSPVTPSFPSGHAASSFAAAMSLSGHLDRGKAYIWMLASLISISRIYLLFHFPADIAAGAVIGSILGLSVPMLFKH